MVKACYLDLSPSVQVVCSEANPIHLSMFFRTIQSMLGQSLVVFSASHNEDPCLLLLEGVLRQEMGGRHD